MNAVVQGRRRQPGYPVLAAMLWSATAASFAQGTSAVMVTPPSPVEIAAGQSAAVRIEVRVTPGYHVQANPVRNPSLVPITVELAPVGGVLPGRAVYPPSKVFRIVGGSEDLVVYDGIFFIQIPVRVTRAQRPGMVLQKGTLRYQACTDKICLTPRNIPLRIPIRVVVG
jgi:hypothetical protein